MNIEPLTVVVAGAGIGAREALRRLLQPHGSDIHFLGDLHEGTGPVDVVLCDVAGLGIDADAVGAALSRTVFGAGALWGATFPEPAVRHARRWGVRSMISKALAPTELVDAIVQVAAGRVVDASTPAAEPDWLGRERGLSPRESQVLLLCAQGLSNREIAARLFVNVETVKSHLKHVYGRLGIHNRAQAAAWAHRNGGVEVFGSPTAGTVEPAQDAADPAATDPAATGPAGDPGLDAAELDERRSLMGIDEQRRVRLRAFAAAAEANADLFVERLTSRWLAHPTTAAYFDDRSALTRLVGHQRRYLAALFGGSYDRAHVEAMLRTGRAHHRIRLSPQWYLASCAHVVCDHLDLLLPDLDTEDPVDAIESVVALVSSVLFDAGLVLDAYELSVAHDLIEDQHTSAMADPTTMGVVPEVGGRPSTAPAPVRGGAPRRPPVTRMSLLPGEAEVRREFLELDHERLDRLRSLTSVIRASVPGVLAGFYETVGSSPAVASLVPPAVVARLLDRVGEYWSDMSDAAFDDAHGVSRMRVGVIHEHIGLSPPLYLAGLANQLGGMLRALVRPGADLRRDIDVMIRSTFFDATFVIDAYLEARAETLLQTGRFASQVVSGLANGVAIIDGRDRVEFANEHLLQLLSVSAAVLRRMPAESAFGFPGIAELVAAARRAGDGRASALHSRRGRTLRVTALRLQQSGAGPDRVAVVLDDITEVLRASAVLEADDRRFDQVLTSVDAMVWELDADTGTVLAMSRGSAALTGVRDVDLLGRRRFFELVDERDRPHVEAACRALRDGERRLLDHRIVHRNGEVRWMRSSVVATGSSGARTVSGVTVDATEIHRAHDERRRVLVARVRDELQAALEDARSAAGEGALDRLVPRIEQLLGSLDP